MDITTQDTQETRLTKSQVPLGFRFAAVRAGIKASGNPDFACAVADEAAAAAAMFTSNRVIAAPLIVGERHLARGRGRIRALVVNAGNANCATGEPGILATEHICARAAELFGCEGHAVFPSSTGIIGVPLPEEKLLAALPALRSGLGSSPGHLEQLAGAIMTTDTRSKIAAASIEAEGRTVRLAGVAKGAGMIHPRLRSAHGSGYGSGLHATMLVYLFTDAAMDPRAAEDFLKTAVESTFNRISIDGDTSTNDTVLLLASGASGVTIDGSAPRVPAQAAAAAFSSALHEICLSLAKQIVEDGEGVQHVVELEICGAASDADALQIARSIAHSPLVKTSWAGCDPNWGRVLAAIGYSGAPIDPARVNIYLGGMELCRAGGVSPDLDKESAHEYLKQRNLLLRVELGLGNGACRFWTTDLTTEYVHINADYST